MGFAFLSSDRRVNNDISDNNKQIDQSVFYVYLYNIIMRPRILHHLVDLIPWVYLYNIKINNLVYDYGRETNYSFVISLPICRRLEEDNLFDMLDLYFI